MSGYVRPLINARALAASRALAVEVPKKPRKSKNTTREEALKAYEERLEHYAAHLESVSVELRQLALDIRGNSERNSVERSEAVARLMTSRPRPRQTSRQVNQ